MMIFVHPHMRGIIFQPELVVFELAHMIIYFFLTAKLRRAGAEEV